MRVGIAISQTLGEKLKPFDMTLIATARASDGISEIWWLIAWAALIISAVLGIVALVTSAIPRGNRMNAIWIAVIGGAISLIPVLFTLYIYQIDFVAVGGDGTPASPPILTVIAWPLLPFLLCLAAAGTARARLRHPVNQP